MKIAEALVKMKDIKGKINELNRHIQSEARFERVDENAEVPSVEESITELFELSGELGKLKTRVASTNATSGLSEKIHEMAQLRGLVSQLEPLVRQRQSITSLRRVDYDGPHVKVENVATYDITALTEKVETARSRIRELDLTLQRMNWEIELAE